MKIIKETYKCDGPECDFTSETIEKFLAIGEKSYSHDIEIIYFPSKPYQDTMLHLCSDNCIQKYIHAIIDLRCRDGWYPTATVKFTDNNLMEEYRGKKEEEKKESASHSEAL